MKILKAVNPGLPLDQQNKYFYELNFIRAIAALSVVMVHVTAANYHLNNSHLNWLLLFFNQMSRFGTPMFAVISGFLLYNQAINGRYNVKKFMYSRFTKIIIPFIIWSVFYLFLKSYSFSEINDIDSIKKFLYDFILGKSYYHLYFIAVVIQFYILFPILQKFHSKKQLLFLTLVALYLNVFSLMTSVDFGSGLLNQFLNERAFIFKWIFYFFLGGLFVHYWDRIVKIIQKNMKFILSIGIIAVLFMFYDYQMSEDLIGSTRLTNLLHVPVLMIALTGLYFLLGSYEKLRNILLEIGNMSMGIYLVHPLVIYFIRNDLSWLMQQTRWIPLAYVLTLVLSILIVKIIHKLPLGHYIVIIANGKKGKKG